MSIFNALADYMGTAAQMEPVRPRSEPPAPLSTYPHLARFTPNGCRCFILEGLRELPLDYRPRSSFRMVADQATVAEIGAALQMMPANSLRAADLRTLIRRKHFTPNL